jgi:hypothetical protein|nr:MAG TPA: Rubredoxin loop, ELECTRON TRANSPORT [Caudoviricetes sp.]
MTVTKCDRCGRIYETLGIAAENNFHISTSGVCGLIREELDLCCTCATDFKKFMAINPRETDFRDLIEYDKRHADGQTS